jgi:outer membrane biosynthesis protein TonB
MPAPEPPPPPAEPEPEPAPEPVPEDMLPPGVEIEGRKSPIFGNWSSMHNAAVILVVLIGVFVVVFRGIDKDPEPPKTNTEQKDPERPKTNAGERNDGGSCAKMIACYKAIMEANLAKLPAAAQATAKAAAANGLKRLEKMASMGAAVEPGCKAAVSSMGKAPNAPAACK